MAVRGQLGAWCLHAVSSLGISWARNILENAVQSEVPLRTLRKGHIRHGRQQMPCTIIQALLLRIAA